MTIRVFVLVVLILWHVAVVDASTIVIKHKEEVISQIAKGSFFIPYLPDLPLVDVDQLNLLTEQIEGVVYKTPINAIIDEQNQIKPEIMGYELDEIEFKRRFMQSFYDPSSSYLEIPLKYLYPKVDSELLTQIRTKQIGYYVTYFNPNNKTRSHNISLASEAINNVVIFPNESFSFNEIVGKRTAGRGYLPAPVIVKGELTEGIGGGICQVSSTLFNAVDRAGVEILQRYSHSKRVPYVPPGRDATVSWYGPDFTFKNTYNQPILIRSVSNGGSIIIMIFSSDTIEYEPRNISSISPQLPEEMTNSSPSESLTER
ncbi:VanW family protein [Cytobacillus spongiae]|uniref:VanW family protein n=1 Tax=Cytobacillus spongiae TaxID=2901381 RepID=UPI001F18D107|nr:VanW family protein [Cytobacillus spongiae]UII54322.1 VanW family protein [Cytobacillus spongiae]